MTLETDLFPRRSGELYIGDVPLRRLTALEPTPFYVLDTARVRRRLEALQTVGGSIYYAIKANANVEVIRMLADWGVEADVCSLGDVAFANAAGIADNRLSYTSTSMSDGELAEVAARGVFFIADSFNQVDRYGAAAAGRAVGIRVNAGIEAGFHPAVVASAPASKFGVPLEDLGEAVSRARRAGLEVTALHGHLASDLLDYGPHLRLLDALIGAAAAVGSVKVIDLGGGWGVPFAEDQAEYDVKEFAEGVRTRLRAFCDREGREVELRLEPGAYLLRDAGYLVTSVVEVNRRGGVVQVGLDSSTNHLPGAMLFGTQHPAAPSRSAPTGGPRAVVVGNLLQGGDVMLRDAPFGHLRPGEGVVFGLAGAYTAVRASTFNQRPRPAALLVQGGTVTRVRRAERIDELLAQECAVRLI